jgi:hypothetical protein
MHVGKPETRESCAKRHSIGQPLLVALHCAQPSLLIKAAGASSSRDFPLVPIFGYTVLQRADYYIRGGKLLLARVYSDSRSGSPWGHARRRETGWRRSGEARRPEAGRHTVVSNVRTEQDRMISPPSSAIHRPVFPQVPGTAHALSRFFSSGVASHSRPTNHPQHDFPILASYFPSHCKSERTSNLPRRHPRRHSSREPRRHACWRHTGGHTTGEPRWRPRVRHGPCGHRARCARSQSHSSSSCDSLSWARCQTLRFADYGWRTLHLHRDDGLAAEDDEAEGSFLLHGGSRVC